MSRSPGHDIAIQWVLLLVSLSVLTIGPAFSQAGTVAIIDVRIVGVADGSVRPGRTVLVEDGRIVAIGLPEEVAVPRDAEVLDADGDYLIPGLWDMHSHTWGADRTREVVFPLEIANGVVGIRSVAGDCHGDAAACAERATFEQIEAMEREIASGELLGPEIHNASTFLDGPHSIKDGSIVITTAAEARRVVRRHEREGFDLLKVYDYLPRDVYFALADEAARQGISFAGHVPWTVSVEEAARAGQKSMEHGSGLFEAVSGLEEEFVEERRQALQSDVFTRQDRQELLFAPGEGQFPRMFVAEERRFRFAGSRFQALVDVFRENGTWQVPTLTMNSRMIGAARTLDEDLLRYIPADRRRRWRRLIAASEQLEPRVRAFYQAGLSSALELVGRMHDAGVGILAGTDCDVDLIVPGFHLHRELEFFVEAGLSPLEALQTATLNPARYLGREAEMGTVEEGKMADLVLLEADPLEDIRNTARVKALILDGRLLDREALDRLLDGAAAAAR